MWIPKTGHRLSAYAACMTSQLRTTAGLALLGLVLALLGFNGRDENPAAAAMYAIGFLMVLVSLLAAALVLLLPNRKTKDRTSR